MLHVPIGTNTYGSGSFTWQGVRPSTTAQGVLVTPQNAANAYGTFVQLFPPIPQDAYSIALNINANNTTATSRNTAIRIGIDEAGGTTYGTTLISDLLCGSAVSYLLAGGGMWYNFPIYIPSGSSIAVAARGSVATTFRVGAYINQMPYNPAQTRRGSYVDSIGVTLGTAVASGVTVVPGTTAEGAWTLIGTTTRRCWYWEFGIQMSTADTNWGANVLHVDIGVGDGTVAGTDIIIREAWVSTDAAEQFAKLPLFTPPFADVPAGSNIYARIQNSGANDAYQVAVYGLGG